MVVKKTYLITGASGFIGRNLCEILIKKRHIVYAISEKDDLYLKSLGVIFIKNKWDEIEKIKISVKKFNIIVHCAANPVFGNGYEYYKINYLKTKKIIKFFEKKNPLIKFIFLSSIGAVDRDKKDNCSKELNENSVAVPTTDYGKSKLLIEEFLEKSILETISIRPSLVIGEQMRSNSHFSVFSKKIIKKNIFSYFDWTGKMSILDVRDLVNAIYFLSIKKNKKKSEIFFCAGQIICLIDFMKLIKPKITFIKISAMLRKINSKIFNLPFRIRALILPALVASDQKLINLGWKKKYNAKDTLRTIIKKENYLIDPIKYPPPSGITLITGASSGLGKEFLYKLTRVRDKIIVIDKDIRPIKKFAKKFKDKIKLIKADLSNTESLESLIFNGYLSKYKISEAFLCAGIAHKSKLLDTNYKIHEKIFKINFLSSLIIINKAYTDMNYLNYGNIVIINSSSSFQPLPHLLSYSASKVALKFLGQGMAIENENSNIKILNVYPGGMKTNFQRNSNVKIIKNEKLLSTTYVYTEIMKALKNKKKNLIVGFNGKVMFYASKFIPELLLLKFFNILMKKLR